MPFGSQEFCERVQERFTEIEGDQVAARVMGENERQGDRGRSDRAE